MSINPKLGYSNKTEALIKRMCKNVERKDFTLKKKQAAECVLKTYDLFNIPRPKKVVWCLDIFDKEFSGSARLAGSAWSAGLARSARSAGSAGLAGLARSARLAGLARSAGLGGSAWSAGSARLAGSAWSAGSARLAGSAWSARSAGLARLAGSAWSAGSAGSAGLAGLAWLALDYDFNWFVVEYEYRENPIHKKINENDKLYLQYSELFLQAKEFGCGYRLEWEDTLYLVPTPLVCIDNQSRFHSEEGPAIRWKGGTESYSIHGVGVKEKIIKTPKKLTKKDWLEEKNVEVRRIIQERMGERFVKEIGSKVIHKGKRGSLVEVDLKDDPDKVARYAYVKDSSTSRKYYLRVPPTVETIDEALAWTFDLKEEEYSPEVES